METSNNMHHAEESQNVSAKKQGFRRLKGFAATVLLGASLAAVGILGTTEPAQAGGRYYRHYGGHRSSYRYYAPVRRSSVRCYRGVRYWY
jgi:hypothetical protein